MGSGGLHSVAHTEEQSTLVLVPVLMRTKA